jgi:2-polyprenyl-6-methoxyphenol hydroxylase-like FAD-dependent oxidoreductase
MTLLTRSEDRRAPAVRFGTAVVIGGSMAGLLAARVLADVADRVLVLDRDRFPERPVHRSGVPQSRHGHAFLVRGREVVEELLPGFTAEMAAEGAIVAEMEFGRDSHLKLVGPFGAFADARSGREFIGASRPLLEWHVRRRLAALPGVELRDGVKVEALVPSPDGRGVVGVIARPTDDRAGSAEITADLVVDASGRRSPAPRWLTGLGFGTAPETTVESGLGYATRWYRKPATRVAGWDALIVNARPPDNPRAGLVLPVEDDLWTVTIAGFAGFYPPTDEAGFRQWTRDLADPSLAAALDRATPVSEIHGYRTPVNRLRRFESLDRWPSGFVVTGDAVCAFNPIYGQGMTTSALAAVALRDSLRSPGGDFERTFRRRLARTVSGPWQIAIGEDSRWDVPVHGDPAPVRTRALSRYGDAVLAAATDDATVSAAYLQVMQMLAPPTSLARPDLALRVLAHHLRRGRGRPRRRAGAPAAVPSGAPA